MTRPASELPRLAAGEEVTEPFLTAGILDIGVAEPESEATAEAAVGLHIQLVRDKARKLIAI